jgi:lipopolysaccharide export system permease protein
MNILFITSSRLGDAVLSMGLLDHIIRTRSGARITVACGALPAPLFEGVPGLERIIVMKKRNWNRHWIFLWGQCIGTEWDIVVDLRDSAVSRLLRARERYIHTAAIDKSLHKVEQNAAVMKLDCVPGPRLWVAESQSKKAKEFLFPSPDPRNTLGSPSPVGRGLRGGAEQGEGMILAIGPTANWPGKMWPAENFIELIGRITAADGVLPGARVAVFAAPGEEATARKVLSGVPAERQIDMIAKCDPGTAAAALSLCTLYVGNDSGLMHCAAAAGIPTLGLFGPSWPHLYRPWGSRAAYVSTPEDYAALTSYEGYDPAKVTDSLMRSLTVEKVINVLKRNNIFHF